MVSKREKGVWNRALFWFTMTQPPSAHLATSDEGDGTRAAASADADPHRLVAGCSEELRIANCEMRNAKSVHCPGA
jgi:hypothetical protein